MHAEAKTRWIYSSMQRAGQGKGMHLRRVLKIGPIVLRKLLIRILGQRSSIYFEKYHTGEHGKAAVNQDK